MCKWIQLVCFVALFVALSLVSIQAQQRPINIYLEVKESNLNQPATVGTNTLTERLKEAAMKVVTKRKDANVVIEGTMNSRAVAVTDDVQKQGGVNAEASVSLRLLAGGEVIATSVVRSSPGDWGVSAERVGEDRLIEAAGLAADDLLDSNFVNEVVAAAKPAGETTNATEAASKAAAKGGATKTAARPKPKTRAPKRGVSFLEIVSLLQSYVPADRIAGAVKKYGIKFKANEAAIAQLRSSGASESVIAAIRSSATG